MRISFGLKMGLAIFLLAVGSTGAGVYYYYSITSDLMFRQMSTRMRDLAHMGAYMFTDADREMIKRLKADLARDEVFDLAEARELEDGDTLESLTEERANYYHARADYARIVQVLRLIKAGGRAKVTGLVPMPQRWTDAGDVSKIKYSYLLVPMPQFSNGVTQKFLADSDWEEVDMNGNGRIDEDEEANPVGNLYKTDDLIFPRALDGELGTSGEWYTDRWGTFLSSAAPIRDRDGTVLAVLGLDLDVSGEANRLRELERLLYTIIGVSIGLSILVAFALAYLLHRPIEKLRVGAERVRDRDFDTVVDVHSRDELGVLATAFNGMVGEIRDYARNLEQKVADRTAELKESLNRVQELKTQQDGDYYLTTLLADPLFRDWNKSERVSTRFLLKQKKSFQFRKWPGELGGDLCVTGNLRFHEENRVRRYTMVCNADAMGKSMQGAGGAIVMGTVLNSIMHRSAAGDRVLTMTPETWLVETRDELQSVFGAFDGSMACSAFLAIIDDETGLMRYFNAEHPMAILYRNGRATFFQEEMHMHKIGMPQLRDDLGILRFQLQTGDVIIAGSDGRDDLRFKDGVMNDDENMILRVVENCQADLDRIVADLSARGEITDDLSLLSVGYQAVLSGGQDGSKQRITINHIAGLIRQKQYATALAMLEAGPPNAGMLYYYYRGMCLHKLSRSEEALQYLEKAATMNRDQSAVPDLLGRVYHKLGRNTEAKRYWEQSLQMNPDNSKIRTALEKISAASRN